MKYTRLTLATVLLLAGNCSDALAKKNICRSVKESKDAFSNELTRQARLGISGGSGYWIFTLEQKGTDYYLTVDVQVGSVVEKLLPAEDIVYIKLQNGQTIELALDAAVKPTFQAGYSIATTWSVRKKVPLETMKQLGASLITAAKVQLDDRELTLTTRADAPKAMEAIRDAAICISGGPAE